MGFPVDDFFPKEMGCNQWLLQYNGIPMVFPTGIIVAITSGNQMIIPQLGNHAFSPFLLNIQEDWESSLQKVVPSLPGEFLDNFANEKKKQSFRQNLFRLG